MRKSAGSTSGFGLGLFDDDDLAEGARRAGFELAVARDLFVHHFGSRTFVGNGVDAEELLEDNARRFAQKWGLSGTNGRRVALRPFVARPQNGNGQEESDCPQIAQMDADGKAMTIKQLLTPSHLSPPCKGGAGGVGRDQSCAEIPRRAIANPSRELRLDFICRGEPPCEP